MRGASKFIKNRLLAQLQRAPAAIILVAMLTSMASTAKPTRSMDVIPH
jgi:hypothetical protein